MCSKIPTLAFILLIMSLTACSSTTMISTWKDPDSQSLHFQKGDTVIALVMSPNEGVRRPAEDALAKELTSRGIIKGVPAYTIIPTEDLRNETQAKAHITGSGASGVVAMRVVGKSQKVTSSLPGYVGPRSELELEVGRKVANALSENLVNELGAYGILAERATRTPSTTENVLMVKGQFVSINEGNSTQRMVVGFGLGRSIVRAQGQVYQMAPQGKRHIGGFDLELKSGRKPGMGPMVGAGAAMGNIAVSAGVSGGLGVASEASDSLPFSASLEANVQKMSKELAKKAARVWVKRGWLPPQVLK